MQNFGGMMQPQPAQQGGFDPQRIQDVLARLQDPQQRMAAAQMFAQQFDVPDMQGFGQIPPPMGGPQLPAPPSLGMQMQPAQMPMQQQQPGGMQSLGSLIGMIPGLAGGGGGMLNPSNSNIAAVMQK